MAQKANTVTLRNSIYVVTNSSFNKAGLYMLFLYQKALRKALHARGFQLCYAVAHLTSGTFKLELALFLRSARLSLYRKKLRRRAPEKKKLKICSRLFQSSPRFCSKKLLSLVGKPSAGCAVTKIKLLNIFFRKKKFKGLLGHVYSFLKKIFIHAVSPKI